MSGAVKYEVRRLRPNEHFGFWRWVVHVEGKPDMRRGFALTKRGALRRGARRYRRFVEAARSVAVKCPR